MRPASFLKRPLYCMLLLMPAAAGCAGAQRATSKTDAAKGEILLTAQQAAARIQILAATQETWTGGAPGSRGDTEYNIRLRLGAGAPLRFESLWYAGKEMPLHPLTSSKGITVLTPNTVFSTDTVIQLHASASAGREPSYNNPKPDQPTITYTLDGKKYRFLLPPFTRLQKPNRP